MLVAMGFSSFLCIFLGCNPQWLYELLPNGASGYHPYDATHVITQLEILLFSALAFTLLNLWGKYPPELPSVNLDIDWVYRKVGRSFLAAGASFWNGLNQCSHTIFIGGITRKVCTFAKGAQANSMGLLVEILDGVGLQGVMGKKSKQTYQRRARLGLYPIGLTAFLVLLLMLVFLLLSYGS
jgi:multicomponent Na+:H+ antiporter subunit D